MADIVKMKVIGIGGAGCNIVSRMAEHVDDDVVYCCINTDKATLDKSGVEEKVQIGERMTKGQGAGSRPDVGRQAAEESRNNITRAVEGMDAVYITAGMGGGTGTGAAKIVAEEARAAGALTIGVVTTPFRWEGARKMRVAEEGIRELLECVDTLIVIPNENLRKVSEQKVTFASAFSVSDEVLEQIVTRITYLLNNTGYINLDFRDLTAILKNGGLAHLGVGEASGHDKVRDVVNAVVSSELTGTDIKGAQRIIVNIVGSPDVALDDVTAVMEQVQNLADQNANIIFGFSNDEEMNDAIRMTLIATDFNTAAADAAAATPTIKPAPAKEQKVYREAEPAARREPAPVAEPEPEPEAKPEPKKRKSLKDEEWEKALRIFFDDDYKK